MKKMLTVTVMSFLFIGAATAGVCKIHYNRTACKGKDAESYSKCGGKKECDQMKPAASADECQKLALEACSNARVDITKTKIINAKFDNVDLKGTDGNLDFCVAYPKAKAEFNQCE